MPTQAYLRPLITIENNTVDALAANLAFRQQFPQLAAMVRPKEARTCGRCRKRQRATLAEYRDFKNALAALPPEDKIRFKQFMHCQQVRVIHVNSANRITDRTF
jgi:hypothetical protein